MNTSRIDDIDKVLLEYNNKISLLEYRESKEKIDLSSEIQQVYHDIESLFASVASNELEIDINLDPIKKKKTQIFGDLIKFSRIENHPEIFKILNKVKTELQKLNYMDTLQILIKNPDQEQRKKAINRIAEFCKKNENLLEQFILFYNKIAQQNGYINYAQAKLESEGLSDKSFVNYFKELKENLFPGFLNVKDPYDLYYQFGKLKSKIRIPEINSQQLLKNLFSDLGILFSELPIKMEWEDLDFSGACFRVSIGKDVRLIVNKNLSGLSSLHYLLHEIGHAVYYCFCPMNSELLIDAHISREIMADIWTQFLKDKRFLQKYLFMDSDLIQKYLEISETHERLSLMIQIRDSLFMYEALKNPTVPLPKTWQKVTMEWLEMDDTSGAFDIFDFFNPLDSKSYVFASDLSHKYFNKVTNNGTTSFLRPDLLSVLIKDLYASGSTINWKEKFNLK